MGPRWRRAGAVGPRARRYRFRYSPGQMDEVGRLTGPVEGQPGILMAAFDLGRVGYTLEEFFLEGTATSFEHAGAAGLDGRWQVAPSRPGPFARRRRRCRR